MQLTLLLCYLLLCDDITPIIGLNRMVIGQNMMMDCEGDWVSLVISILYVNYDYLCLVMKFY